MLKIDDKFKMLEKNDKLNTSYPIEKEDWLKYKIEGELSLNEDKLCYYFHIPFCLSKCKFCEYVKYVKGDESLEDKYVDLLLKDVKKFKNQHDDACIYGLDVGGGTPTCLSENNLKKLLSNLKELMLNSKLSSDFEPSIESTFITISEEKLKIIAENGFKRISFGLQTVNKKFLRDNDRVNPTLEKMKDSFLWCKKYGIEKINIDFMYGLKNQTKKDLKNAVELVKFFMPEQVTLYEFRTNILKVKENKTKNQLFRQYCYLFKHLIKLGYYGNFGQNTFSMNANDLGCSSYIRNRMINNISYKGFGISAQSKGKDGVSYNIGKSDRPLEDCLKEGGFGGEDTYALPKEEMLAKYIAISGYCGRFDLNIMTEILGRSARGVFKDEFDFLLKKKYIKIIDNIAQITKKGFKHYGAVLSLFYPNIKIDNFK